MTDPWADAIQYHYEDGTPVTPHYHHTTAELANWLAHNAHHLAQHPDAAALADELHQAITNATHTIDRPPDTWYAGRCGDTSGDSETPCGGELYARSGAKLANCPNCGATYNLDERRTWLRHAVHDVLATTTEISRALTSLDTPVTADSIRGYVRRGQLAPRGHDGHQPLYRVGDVADLVTATLTRRARP